ncbi:hypothetical protein [Bacillus sp. FJAT-45037]|uniref:hypothetical protein n=1 Tax=Bacillus sp. FJAT-45037 TaxID=2011007 RepID=UPI003FA46B90
MVQKNFDLHQTALTVSIDHTTNKTGISAIKDLCIYRSEIRNVECEESMSRLK